MSIGSGAGDDPSGKLRIRLANGGALLLEPDSFRLVGTRGLRRSPRHAYESLTHVAASDRVLLIGTTTGTMTIRAGEMVDPGIGPREARRLLLERLARRPDGAQVLEDMENIERLARLRSPRVAVWGVAALCLVGTALQIWNPYVEQAGSFIPELFMRGELWRGVTAHFLHAMPLLPIHLLLNLAGLFVLGHFVEQPLGSWRTVLLLGLGGVGAMAGSMLYDHPEVIGSSGLVAALAGGILALELHHPDALPVRWRLPRRVMIGALIAQFVLDQVLGNVLAGGAHLGGFMGGYAAIWLLGRPSIETRAPGSGLRFATGCVVGAVGLSVLAAIPLVRHDPESLQRHALRLLNTPVEPHLAIHENAAAWFLATEGDPTREGIQLAVLLADRAVSSTGRREPNYLDTLAEALFQAGDQIGALLTIDEAIRLMPRERYFVEQRRRFTGERDPDDRPAPPGSPLEADPRHSPPEDQRFDPEAPAIVL